MSVWGPRLLWCLVLGYCVSTSLTLVRGYLRASDGLPPLLLEFTPTYAASMLLREHPPATLYERVPMHDYTRRAVPAMYPEVQPIWIDAVRYPPWLYPPHFIPLVMPLALVPFWWAFLFWNVATAIPYLAAMRRILPARVAWPVALAAPPVLYNALQGQTGFFIAGLVAMGLAVLPRAPVFAGILLGAASVKPHFGLLIPLALVAGGHWRTLVSATLTVLALVGASLLLFGAAPWVAFFQSATANLQGFESNTYKYIPMTTVLGGLALAGLDLQVARMAQFCALLLMVGAVAWAWWRRQGHPQYYGLCCATLCLATPLALPMAYIYDLVLIVPAAAWIGMDLRTNGARHWEWGALMGSMAALLLVVTLADSFRLQIGAVLLAWLLALALHRMWGALQRTARISQPVEGEL